MYERPVDLQLVEGKAPQVTQRGITSAKIVQRESQAMALEFRYLDDHVIDIVHQHALVQFEL